MYTKPVVIYQGIDNPIQVRVKNQAQVPVNMTQYALQIDIQDPENYLTVSSFGVAFQNVTKGLGSFVIPRNLVNQLDQRQYKLTFRVINTDSNNEQPVYIDDNYTVPLDLIVMPGYYAEMQPDQQEANDFTNIDGGTI